MAKSGKNRNNVEKDVRVTQVSESIRIKRIAVAYHKQGVRNLRGAIYKWLLATCMIYYEKLVWGKILYSFRYTSYILFNENCLK